MFAVQKARHSSMELRVESWVGFTKSCVRARALNTAGVPFGHVHSFSVQRMNTRRVRVVKQEVAVT